MNNSRPYEKSDSEGLARFRIPQMGTITRSQPDALQECHDYRFLLLREGGEPRGHSIGGSQRAQKTIEDHGLRMAEVAQCVVNHRRQVAPPRRWIEVRQSVECVLLQIQVSHVVDIGIVGGRVRVSVDSRPAAQRQRGNGLLVTAKGRMYCANEMVLHAAPRWRSD